MTFATLITTLTIENLDLCYMTINCDTGQHSQFLRCFYDTSSGLDGGGSAEAASQPQRQKRTKSKGKFDRSFFVVFTSDDKIISEEQSLVKLCKLFVFLKRVA